MKVRFSRILTRGFSFLSGSTLQSALRVANFQIKNIVLKESLWDQGENVVERQEQKLEVGLVGNAVTALLSALCTHSIMYLLAKTS